MNQPRRLWANALCLAAIVLIASGCTSLHDYIANGLKVGPDYKGSEAHVAQKWIDSDDLRVRSDQVDLSHWWGVFQDPALDHLIDCAYHQNLTLRQAAFRILQARAQLGIAVGNFFPQQQAANGSYQRLDFAGAAASAITPEDKQKLKDLNLADMTVSQFAESWNFGFNLAWEIDFWGRLRRAIVSAQDTLDASCAGYDDVLVTLLGDVATNYVQLRTLQKQIEFNRENAKLQEEVLVVAQRRYEAGGTNELDVDRQRSLLEQTNAQICALEDELRQAVIRLCVLMGMPPEDLTKELGIGPIPTAPATVVAGIPADLLRRRPDVRRAERLAAAQAEQIGIAEAALYPIFSIDGSLGWSAGNFSQLFTPNALNSTVGPAFSWQILNYGRIVNNMRYQDAKFRELVVAYQSAVLQANAEVEAGLSTFLHAQERTVHLDSSVAAGQKAVNIVLKQYRVGTIDYTAVAQVERDLLQAQLMQAQAYGEIGRGLIQVYRALGGGWEIRCQGDQVVQGAPPPAANTKEEIPSPPHEPVEHLPAPPQAPQPIPEPPPKPAT